MRKHEEILKTTYRENPNRSRIIEIGTGYTSIPAKIGAATEIVIEELTNTFISKGLSVDIIDIADSKRIPNHIPIHEVDLPSCFLKTGTKLGFRHKLKRVVYSIALTRTLHSIIKESKEKVLLHFHNQYNLFFFLLLTSKKKIMDVDIAYTVHSYIWSGEWNKIKDIVKKRYFQEMYCVKHVDYVFVLNDNTSHCFIHQLGVSQDKTWKVANGVNTEIYTILNSNDIQMFKKNIGMDGKHIILQVGSICERKNQRQAIELLGDYLVKNSDVVYLYAGGIIDENYKESIDSLAIKMGIKDQVIYIGEITPGRQLNNYYNAAECTIFPSKLESFGLVIIESLATGTPVLLTEVPHFGMLAGMEVFSNPEELTKCVDKAFDEKNHKNEIRGEVLAKYSWDEIGQQYNQIWTHKI